MILKQMFSMAMVVLGTAFASAEEGQRSWTFDVNQYGAIKSVSSGSGFVLKGSPLRKRPEAAHKKYGYWWAVQGSKKYDLEPGIKEEKKEGETIVERNGFMGSNEYRIKYAEKIVFRSQGEFKLFYEAVFLDNAGWTYPLFVDFSLSSELVEGRGYLIVTLDGGKEKGIIPLKAAAEKELIKRKIKTLGISTNKGAVHFCSGENTEIWLILKNGSATVQFIAANYPHWRTQVIKKGQKKTLDFSIKLPGLKQ